MSASPIDINSLLTQMKTMAAQAQGKQDNNLEQVAASKAEFSNIFANQLDKVNDAMQYSAKMKDKFVMGDPDVTLPDVMIAGERSSIYFNMTMEMRNKVIEAYNQIMNMSV